MRLNRFINPLFDLSREGVFLDGEEADQIRKTLRMKVGERIILCDGNFREAIARISAFVQGGIEVEIETSWENPNESHSDVTLYCAILKKENFEWVAQKATEAGVKRIIPLLSRRTIKTGVKKERLEKIAKEAAEQSGRGIIPLVGDPMGVYEAMEESAKENDGTVFLALGGDAFDARKQKGRQRGIFVGPEGGWSEEEEDQAREKGFLLANLGPFVLRAETAAIIGSYLAVHC